MTLKFEFAEAKSAPVAASSFTPEFIEEFDYAWTSLKDNPGRQATVIFENAQKRDKWFNTAKAYGAQHAEKIFVSKVKGTGSDDKASGKLVFKMEPGAARQARVAELKKRAQIRETLAEHGIEFKRGRGSNVDDLYAALLKKTPQERKEMAERTAKARKAAEAKAAQATK